MEHTAITPRNKCAPGRRVRKTDQPPLRSTHGTNNASTIAERTAINTGIDNCDTACLDKASNTASKNTPANIQAMPCSG
jgi:pyruvate/oxaloacetate carboxyltransferase